MPARTGCYSQTKRLDESNKDSYRYLRTLAYKDLGSEVLHAMNDGREYVVRITESTTREHQKYPFIDWTITAEVVLLRPDQARPGELVLNFAWPADREVPGEWDFTPAGALRRVA